MSSDKLAATLKELRDHKGLTQKALSQELNIGSQTYSHYETGKRQPDLDTLCKIAAYYEVSLDQLVITGLHPVNKDPFAGLPEDYQHILRTYHGLSLENQKSFRDYLEFLAHKEK